MIWKPHPYQKKAVSWLINHPAGVLFLDPGLGKTSIALEAFRYMQKAKGVKKALVVAPLKVCQYVWTFEEMGELAKWDNFRHFKIILLHGSKKDESIKEDADLYVINYDGIMWLHDNDYFRDLKNKGVDTLILDELSKLKHSRTKRFKALKKHLNDFKRRWGLTGSPASNGLLDLFGQMYTIDLGKSLGKYITHYRNRYFNPTGYGGYTWVLQEGADKLIYKAISKTALSMKAEDYLDLPKLIEQNIWVTLSPKSMQIYNDMEKEFIVALEEGVITAANAAVASSKCRQVASGGLYMEGEFDNQRRLQKRRTIVIHNEKTKGLSDLIDELQGRPVLVGYEFNHDLERIQKAFSKKVRLGVINGATSDKGNQQTINKWNSNKLDMLLGHPKSIGHGLNLQMGGSCHVIWYTTTWDFELYDQFIRRIWRQGSKAGSVFVYRICARKTIDEVVLKALQGKKKNQSNLFEALKKHYGKK